MFLTPEVIEQFKVNMNDPKKRGEYRLFKDCFKRSARATPKHILFKQLEPDFPNLPKFVFYIVMDELYSQGFASDGNLGYMAEYIVNPLTPKI